MPEFGKRWYPGVNHELTAGEVNRLVDHVSRPEVLPPKVLNQPKDSNILFSETAGTNSLPLNPFAVQRIETASWESRYGEGFDREGMRRGVEVKTQTPANEWENHSILQKSAPAASIQPSVVSGPTPARILFRDQSSLDYPYAIPLPGVSDYMLASPYGRARILWHKEPESPIIDCSGVILESYVNLGDDGQWVWFKLLQDLPCCGSAEALLTDECGNQIGECEIKKIVYGPDAVDFCGCLNSCESWKTGAVLPFLWYQYLEKWITVPYPHANFVKKKAEVVSSIELAGLEIQPVYKEVKAITDVQFQPEVIQLVSEARQVPVLSSGENTLDVSASGNVSGTGNVSISDTITLSGKLETNLPVSNTAALTLSAPCTISGSMSGSGPVSLSGGTPKNVCTSIDFQTSELTYEDVEIPNITGASFSGSLNTAGTTISLPVSTVLDTNSLLLEGDVKLNNTLGISNTLSPGHNLSVNVDFTGCFEEKTIITSIKLEGCQLTYTTETVKVWNGLNPACSLTGGVSLSGGVSLTGNVTLDNTLKLTGPGSASGSVNVPNKVNGSISLNRGAALTASKVNSWSPASLSPKFESITIPTSGNATVNCEGALAGTLDVSGQSVTLDGLTVPVNESITVSGPVNLQGTARFNDIPVTVSGTASGMVQVQGLADVETVTQVNIPQEAMLVTKTPIQSVESLTGSASSSNVKTSTLEYLACYCPTENV